MKNKKNLYPNFILYDTGIQKEFAQMCQNFHSQTTQDTPSSDWLIIDNDTGKIITLPSKANTTKT